MSGRSDKTDVLTAAFQLLVNIVLNPVPLWRDAGGGSGVVHAMMGRRGRHVH